MSSCFGNCLARNGIDEDIGSADWRGRPQQRFLTALVALAMVAAAVGASTDLTGSDMARTEVNEFEVRDVTLPLAVRLLSVQLGKGVFGIEDTADYFDWQRLPTDHVAEEARRNPQGIPLPSAPRVSASTRAVWTKPVLVSIHMVGSTVSQILDALVKQDPRYVWEPMRYGINVLPKRSKADATYPLNRVVERFRVDHEPMVRVLTAVQNSWWQAGIPGGLPRLSRDISSWSGGDATFSLSVEGSTLRGLLFQVSLLEGSSWLLKTLGESFLLDLGPVLRLPRGFGPGTFPQQQSVIDQRVSEFTVAQVWIGTALKKLANAVPGFRFGLDALDENLNRSNLVSVAARSETLRQIVTTLVAQCPSLDLEWREGRAVVSDRRSAGGSVVSPLSTVLPDFHVVDVPFANAMRHLADQVGKPDVRLIHDPWSESLGVDDARSAARCARMTTIELTREGATGPSGPVSTLYYVAQKPVPGRTAVSHLCDLEGVSWIVRESHAGVHPRPFALSTGGYWRLPRDLSAELVGNNLKFKDLPIRKFEIMSQPVPAAIAILHASFPDVPIGFEAGKLADCCSGSFEGRPVSLEMTNTTLGAVLDALCKEDPSFQWSVESGCYYVRHRTPAAIVSGVLATALQNYGAYDVPIGDILSSLQIRLEDQVPSLRLDRKVQSSFVFLSLEPKKRTLVELLNEVAGLSGVGWTVFVLNDVEKAQVSVGGMPGIPNSAQGRYLVLADR